MLRRSVALSGIIGLLLLGGCLEKNLLWAPDGQSAIVFGEEGLFLCDGTGHLSALQVPVAYRAAWLGDSRQLVLARRRVVASWDEAAGALGPERAGKLAARAEARWQKLQSGSPWGVATMNLGKDTIAFDKLYLRDKHGAALRALVGEGEWAELQPLRGELHELFSARVENGRIMPGAILHAGLGSVREIRVAPGDQAVAFVAEAEFPERGKPEDELQLWVARLAQPGATLVATRVSAFPDWTANGRALAYVQATAGPERDELRLGTLVQREVFDAQGGDALKTEPQGLAGWMFSDNARVRCLRDGRILFNAAEISLPIAAEDFGDTREQLFALEPARQATLIRLVPRKHEGELPPSLAFYEVSPDEKQVVFGNYNGAVAVFTLASGEVERVQEAAKDNVQGQPVWRAPGELSYTRLATDKAAPRKAEVVLRKAGKEQVLSTGWPDAMVNRWVSEKK